MRSNKELWLRGGAALAWILVLAGAAYALVNYTRKDWRDFTPVEKIGFFTPDHVSWDMILDGGTRVVEVSGTTGSFLIVFPVTEPKSRILVSVCGDWFGKEIEPGSEMEKAILACLSRTEHAGEVPAGVRLEARNLRELLQKRS